MEGTRYSSRLSEQGSRISQPRSDNGRCGWGCFLEWKRRMQRVASPVVVPLVAPVLSDCVRLIPGSAHRDVIRPSVAVACSIYHHRMWNQKSFIVSNCQHIGTPEGRLGRKSLREVGLSLPSSASVLRSPGPVSIPHPAPAPPGF